MFAKKNLVAVAALMAVAGAAQADVKLYGMLDMGVGSVEQAHAEGTSSRTTVVGSGMMMTSYIGISGGEDLGGGLKAEFALESFVAPDTGATLTNNAKGFWGRGSFVALSGNFGKVALGQYDNPLFTAGYTYNPFGSSMAFSPTMRHYYGIYGSAYSLSVDTGWVNSVTYESPVVSGFQFIGQYAPKESTKSYAKNSYTGAVSYNAGPFSAMATYEKAGKTDSSTAYQGDQKIWNLGASYDFGVVKAFGQYTEVKTSGALVFTGTTVTTVFDGNLNAKDKIFQLGVSVPVTEKAAVLVSFGQNKGKADPSEDSYKDEVFSLGYDYTLSKRTDVYAAFSNNRQTDLVSGQTFAVGLRHNF
jgi:predicted porin